MAYKIVESVWDDLKNKHEGDVCFIIGNGKSLADESNEFLSSFPSFGTNRIYLKNFTPTYFCCINPLVASQYRADIERLNCIKFVTDSVPIRGAIPLHSKHIMAFSRNPEKYICEGYTVTYVAMQLAFFMGFKTVYLIGVDHDFKFEGQPNEEIVATGADPNHFDPSYFSGGHLWNAPDLENSEKAYRIAKRVFESEGRKIYNITPNSKLDVFETRMDLWQ